MDQPQTDIAVKVQDKRHYDRLTKWLASQGFHFKNLDGNIEAITIWEKLASDGRRVKALVADTDAWRLKYGDAEDTDTALASWSFLSTPDFKEQVEMAIARRGLDDMPRSYRLLKDSVELRAGTIVTLCQDGLHYKVVTLDLRVFPEDSDRCFPQGDGICFSIMTVENQPDWFERVYQLDQYVTESKYLDIREQLRNGL